MEIYIFIWLALCVVVAYYADIKGHSAVGYFTLSIILSPIIGFILVGISVDKSETIKMRGGKFIKCKFCAEVIKAEAIKCKHCGSDLQIIKGA